MRKKILSLALALAMCLGLTVPAFAASSDNYSANGYTDPTAENVNFSVAPIGAATIRWEWDDWEGTKVCEYTAYVFDQDCIVTRKDGRPLTAFVLTDCVDTYGSSIGDKDFPYANVDVAGISADFEHHWLFNFGTDLFNEDDWSPYMVSKKGLDNLPIENEFASITVAEYRPLSAQPTTPPQPEQPAGTKTASPTNDKLAVNGAEQTPTVYKIGGSNYFKIRDIAAMLNGTEKQFAVGYAGGKVTVTSGQPYEATGKELAGAPSGGKTASPSNDTVIINGTETGVTVYKIGGSNYFKLRDLGKALDFYVGWEAGRGMYIETDKPYS